jgi:hypothetical protein
MLFVPACVLLCGRPICEAGSAPLRYRGAHEKYGGIVSIRFLRRRWSEEGKRFTTVRTEIGKT